MSASDRRKKRPGYSALWALAQAGGLDVVVVWDLDRLTRQPRELEDWIDLAENRRSGVRLITANGDADLATDGGRLFARMKAAVARSEVERKSERQRAAARQRAQLGRPPLGTRLTGYTPAGDVVEHEATAVRQAYELSDGGHSLRAIARHLDATGVRPRRAATWTPSSVRDLLTNPRYCGRVVYHRHDAKQAEEVDAVATWDPIVDAATWDRVNGRLTDPRRRTQSGTERRHLGSGLYRCDECGGTMGGRHGNRYGCKPCGLVRSYSVDEYIEVAVAERLARPDVLQTLTAAGTDRAAIERLDLERARQLERLAQVEADYDNDLIDGARYQAKRDLVRAALEAVERDLAQAAGSGAVEALRKVPNPGTYWRTEAPLAMRREILDLLVEVRLKRARRGVRAFDPESVALIWR